MHGALKMAGVLGFEPRYGEIKTRCLTAWRHPKGFVRTLENGWGARIRT